VTYDRGYALQTKSLLLESTTTSSEAVKQLFEALGLRGSPKDYALEERNIITGGNFSSAASVCRSSSYTVSVCGLPPGFSPLLSHTLSFLTTSLSSLYSYYPL
jgi:hypothetical protein